MRVTKEVEDTFDKNVWDLLEPLRLNFIVAGYNDYKTYGTYTYMEDKQEASNIVEKVGEKVIVKNTLKL